MATCTRRSRWPRSSSRAATRRHDAVRRRRGAGSRRASSPKPATPIDLLPGRGLQRRLTLGERRARGRGDADVRSRTLGASCAGTGRRSSSASAGTHRCPRVRRGAACCAFPPSCTSRTPRPGLANRSACALGARAAVSLPGTPLPGASLTGNPVRAEFAAVRRARPGARRCSPSFGGAQGARTDQRADARLLRPLARPRPTSPCTTSRPAQRRRRARASSPARASRRRPLDYELVGYEDAHGRAATAGATLAVCRAGAGTVAELTVGRRACRARAAARRARAITRRATRDACRAPARPWSSPTPNATPPRLDAEVVANCSPTPNGSRRCAPRRARSAVPTRRRGSPTSSRRHARGAMTLPRRARPRRQPRRVHIVGSGARA